MRVHRAFSKLHTSFYAWVKTHTLRFVWDRREACLCLPSLSSHYLPRFRIASRTRPRDELYARSAQHSLFVDFQRDHYIVKHYRNTAGISRNTSPRLRGAVRDRLHEVLDTRLFVLVVLENTLE